VPLRGELFQPLAFASAGAVLLAIAKASGETGI
jgi:hypothetical protein